MPSIKLLSNYFSFNSKSKNICVFRKKRAKTRKFGKHWRITAQKFEIPKITKIFPESLILGMRGRPRKSVRKLRTPPIYVFIRNLLHNVAYNPSGETLGDIQTDEGEYFVSSRQLAGRERRKFQNYQEGHFDTDVPAVWNDYFKIKLQIIELMGW